MFILRMALHEGGHGHEHTHDISLTPEQTIALLGYTLEHNRSHAEELGDLALALELQGKDEAAQSVHEAIHFFEHGNDRLNEALLLAKGE